MKPFVCIAAVAYLLLFSISSCQPYPRYKHTRAHKAYFSELDAINADTVLRSMRKAPLQQHNMAEALVDSIPVR